MLNLGPNAVKEGGDYLSSKSVIIVHLPGVPEDRNKVFFPVPDN
jgi:hypothetical protein